MLKLLLLLHEHLQLLWQVSTMLVHHLLLLQLQQELLLLKVQQMHWSCSMGLKQLHSTLLF